MKFANVTDDIAFRIIFGDENKKVVLISFLNAVLCLEGEHKITDLYFPNTYQLPKFRDGKSTILDVKATDESGRSFLVEMQVADINGFSKRVLYYTSLGYVSQIDRGVFYDQLRPTIFIGILQFSMSNNDEYIHRHQILNVETGERLLMDMEFNFIELPKFKLELKDLNTVLEKWVYFIKEAEHLNIIPDNMDDKGLQTAFESANIQTWTKEELLAYDYSGMRETDERLKIERGMEKGMEVGIEKGIEVGLEK
ncbi:MAG: Rpn family recombination-promoting nuclease/putative transposase, partial [Saprospiraceae bacterium]|nr:Rpn family recombination-promoting nuclease/putative transposase [Saprospiraceae bacterium]